MVPSPVLPLFWACRNAGGRALLVGGTVRDAILGKLGKDLDIEVHALEIPALVKVLRGFGPVNEVGRSFGVLKLRIAGFDLDVSVPRQDSRQGPGHRGIQATASPYLGTVEAARRRDLTINAIAWDPLEEEFVDPFGGRRDLDAGLLRAVDGATFGEDPLRALRVAQFRGRFGFAVDHGLEMLCREMPLGELPAERVHGEVDKLLLKSPSPSLGWNFAFETGMWAKVLPEWREAPERLDAVAQKSRTLEEDRRRALLYAAACGGNTVEETTRILDRLRLFRWEGYRLRPQVLFLVERRQAPAQEPSELRRLADEGDLELLSLLREEPELGTRAAALGILRGPLPPLLQGRDLTALGLSPGPRMGELLAEVRRLQLDGVLKDAEEARNWLRSRL